MTSALGPPQSALRLLEAAHLQRFLGEIADPEAKTLTALTVNIPRDILACVDRIVGDPHAGYVMHAKTMRESAQRIRVRQEFESAISTYEVQLNDGVEFGNWELIERTLEVLRGYVEGAPDPYWQEHLRRTIARNGAVKRAIGGLYDARTGGRTNGRGAKKKKQGAIAWQHWLESLSGEDDQHA